MPKVVFYNPSERARLKVPYLPFSVMTVASSLKMADIDFSIVDSRIETDAHEKLLAEIQNPEVVLFGLTLMTGSAIYDGLEAARLVHQARPDLKIAVGGVHPSMLPEQTAEHEDVDMVVVGAGEETTVELAKRLASHEPWEETTGIVYRKNGKVIVNPPRVMSDDSHYEGVNYDIVEIPRYIKRDATGERCLDYLSSRGCPHPCTYCAIAEVWGRKMLYYSPERIVNDLERLVKEHCIDSIHFLDDNFFVSRPRVEQFCDEVIRRGIKLKFWAMCRIQYFHKYDDAFLQKLKKAGFCTINFGAESGSRRVLDRLKRNHTPEQILFTAEQCNKYGFRGQFSFMMALPYETTEDLEQTMALIEKIHAVNPNFDMQMFPFTPFPKTELAEESATYGFKEPTRLEDWAKFEYGSIAMPWLAPAMKNRVDTLTTLAWFAFTSETAIKLEGLSSLAYKILGKIARLRFRFRFFDHAYEWKLVNAVARAC